MQRRSYYTGVADTIFALASGPGRAGVSVVRISGPDVPRVLPQLVSNGSRLLQDPNRLAYGALVDTEGQTLDRMMAVYFKAPHSFTGEEACELHLHGSPAVVRAAFALLEGSRLRLARPGEFTQRAFGNGRMSLDQVEAMADLLQAETDQQRRMAIEGMSGDRLRSRLAQWRSVIISCMARVEAWIDFAEEEQIDAESSLGLVRRDMDDLIYDMKDQLEHDRDAELVRSGLRVVIAGPPNSGKSSLLNRLARRKAAIVSPIPGTTRDIIQVDLDIAGFPVTFLDTAGLREAEDAIEREGILLAREAMESADFCLYLGAECDGPNTIMVKSKMDQEAGPWHLSTFNEHVFASFYQQLTDLIKTRMSSVTLQSPLLTRERHRLCVQRAIAHLQSAHLDDVVLSAESLKRAGECLGEITGQAIDHDAVLDALFSTFCIGK